MRLHQGAALLISGLLLTACSVIQPRSAANLEPVPKSPVEFTTWELIALNGALQPAYNVPTLKLDAKEQRAVGYGGCNRYFGGYTLKGEQISFSALGSTRMACAEADMKTEQLFLQELQSVTRLHVDGDTLDLFKGDDMRLRFRAKPAE